MTPATMVTELARALALAAFVALVPACGGSEEDPTTPTLIDGSVAVTSRAGSALTVSTAAPIKLGKNDIGIKAGAGVEVVTVSALMPAHGHGTKPVTVERTADGYRVKELVLYMSGRWEVRFALRAGGAEDEALITVDVP